MYKLLDNTFISASKYEIHSIDLLTIASSEYILAETPEVKFESSRKINSDIDSDSIEMVSDDSIEVIKTMEYLKQAHNWIGPGELSTIVHSMILTHKGIENYVVTDDKAARNLITRVHEDPKVCEYLGFVPRKIKYTGTIGLIQRLKKKGLISQSDTEKITTDLKNSSFRVTTKLLELLLN